MLAVKNSTSTSTIINREVRLMGNNFGISLVADDHTWALARIDSAIAEIARVEKLLSTFTEDSSITAINRNAGIQPVRVDAETYRLIDRALQISELTHGTFDITYNAAVDDHDDACTPVAVAPAKKLKKKINFNNFTNVVLDFAAQTVFLKNKGMRISFGAISHGYAADRAKYVLQMEGVSSGVINAGGDLLTWGLQPDNTPWTIAAADPTQANSPFAGANISDMAVATSYNNEKHTGINSAKINTDINPETGFPVSKIDRVSVITPGAELADAMASPIIAMGVNAGLYLINKLNQIACIIVDDHARVYTSKNISVLM
jgi:thiamine biosynthesis lipoprotein